MKITKTKVSVAFEASKEEVRVQPIREDHQPSLIRQFKMKITALFVTTTLGFAAIAAALP